MSAKPLPEEQEGIPHHLINILDPLNEPYSAGDFAKAAREIIKDIEKRGKRVIIAGGTWFYLKCLLDEKLLPEISRDDLLRKELEKLDIDTLYDMLLKKDGKRAAEIHKNNKERVIRALEMANSGEVCSLKRKKNSLKSIWFANRFALNENRAELYERINLRVDEMIKAGLKEEFDRNLKKFGRTKVLENTIGYKEFFELEDELYKDQREAVEKIKQRTRNFAKRQLTFFKTENRINIVKNEDEILSLLKL